MLSASSLRDKLRFSRLGIGIRALALASVVLLLVKAPYEPVDKNLDKSRRTIHRPETTLPVLENTLSVIQAARVGDVHDQTLLTCRESDARPVLIRSIGIPDQLVVSTPEAFEDVLKIQFSNFPKGSYQCANLRDLLGDGIFAVDGEQWVHQRKTASNLFTMRALRDSMTVVIQRHAVVLYDILQRASEGNETLDLFKLFNRFTIEAFTEIGFGVHMGCLDSEEEHPFQKAFDRAQRALFLRFVRPSWFCRVQKWLNVGAEGQLKSDIEVIDKTVLDIVGKALSKRSNNASPDDDNSGKDIVSLFLGTVGSSSNSDIQEVDPTFLRNIVVNFLIAGRDTTAQTLSWFFLNLTKNPAVEAAIRSEIAEKLPKDVVSGVGATNATMQDVSQLVYLEAA
ncbi:unnamed protein product [Phytophthora fragariaefolia]|uniref:Unnamed protein product n=1 Tax=Phytophthora fragariaefolia TaxID=1490495 RepID=A0A9W6YGV4_9STRA|nr:unnamed protein product [Phytophthora fragariaefolia]